MTVLTDEAEAARVAHEASEAAAVEQERQALLTAAKEAIKAMLVRPDGTYLTLSASGLKMVHDDLENGLAIASDGTVALAARRDKGGEWDVYLVRQVDGAWTKASDALRSLAELGAALIELEARA